MSAGLGFPGPAFTNPNSTMMLPEVTEIITMFCSLIPRRAARPDTNAARRAEPWPNSLMDPVSVINTIGESSSTKGADVISGIAAVVAANAIVDGLGDGVGEAPHKVLNHTHPEFVHSPSLDCEAVPVLQIPEFGHQPQAAEEVH